MSASRVDTARLDARVAQERRGTRRDHSRRRAPAPRRGSRRRRAAGARGPPPSSRACVSRRRSSQARAGEFPRRDIPAFRRAAFAPAAARAAPSSWTRRWSRPASISSWRSSTSFSVTSLKSRCASASGATYQRSSGRRSAFAGAVERAAEARPAHRRTVGRDCPQSLRALAVAQGGHRRSGGVASALESGHALLEIVDQPQRGGLERALVVGERLDVPPHQPAQYGLDRRAETTAHAGPQPQRAVGRDGPSRSASSRAASRSPGPAAPAPGSAPERRISSLSEAKSDSTSTGSVAEIPADSAFSGSPSGTGAF